MTPGLLSVGALAALAAVVVPLIIHIARRSEQRPTDFAALRWLRQTPRPRSRLRFDEWPLLMLRLALLMLLALWLARPVLFGAAGGSAYVAVAPGVDLADAGLLERAHWLAPGFGSIDTARPEATGSIGSLVRELDADLPAGAALTVIVPPVIEGADAEKPRLSRRVDWRISPGAITAGPVLQRPVPSVSIRYDAAHAPGLRYLRAAALAWQPIGREADLEVGAIGAPLPDVRRALIWMGAGTLPDSLLQWVERGGTVVVAADALFPTGAGKAVLWTDDLGRPLVEATPRGGGRLMRFTRRLAPADMPQLLEADFPARLRAVIDPSMPAPTRVAARDYAPVMGGRRYEAAPVDLRPWLAVLIGLLLLGERWVATRRNRGLTP